MSPFWFTPESLFRVSTLGVPPSGADPWVVQGAHLRAWTAPAVGFPLHPFTFWPVRDELLTQPGPVIVAADVIWWVWRDGSARVVGQGGPVDVGKFGTAVYGDLVGAIGGTGEPSPFDPWFCWIRLDVTGSTGMKLDVVGRDPTGAERTLVSRSQPPYALGASRICRIRLTGDGMVTGVFGLDASRLNVGSVDQGMPVKFGLPFDHDNAWYVGAQGSAAGLDRAAKAAPLQAGPPDRPDGPTPIGPDDEVNRIKAITTNIGETAAENFLRPAYADAGALPTRHRTEREVLGLPNPAHLEFGSIETLLLGAADAGLARWLGLAGVQQVVIDDYPKWPLAWISAGIWAVDPQAVVAGPPPVTVYEVMQATHPGALENPIVTDMVSQWSALLQGLYPGLEKLIADATGRGFLILPLTAPAGLGALPDLPVAPDLVLDGPGGGGGGEWEGPDKFTQRVRLRGPSPAGPVGFARTVAGQTTSLHETVATNGPTIADRALTLLAGRAGGPAGMEAVLTSHGTPGTAGQVTWRVAVADEFGRWGPQAHLLGDPPPRPGLPLPTLETFFTADPNRDGGPGARVPGQITVQVPIPPAVQVPVPLPEQLAPGTLAVRTVRITVGDTGQPAIVDVIGLPPGPPDARLITRQFPAPVTQVAESLPVTVTAEFDDGQGGSSKAEAVVSVADPRRPPPVATAPTLLWASPRDPTGQAELALTWPVGPGHHSYRIYVGDERALAEGLGLDPRIPDGMSRAARAQRIWENGERLTDHKWFSLASDPPLEPGNDGSVHFAHRIPGSLRTIQFVRVVPMTPDGVEAPFFRCGLVPVAIPGDDRPPSPAVAARSDGKTIQVEVTAGGLNLDLLKRLQPGGQAVPEFRLRRARGMVADALYLPVVAIGTLTTVPGEPGAFTVQQPDPSTGTLPPFVRHTWVAEIRYPAEIAVTPGTAAVPTPVGADWAVAGPGKAQPSGWSAPSAPVSTMLTIPVPLLTASSAKAADGSVSLSVTGLPVAHPQAVGPWRLRIWRRRADGGVEPLVPGDSAVAATPDPGPQIGTTDSWAVTEPALGLSDRAATTVGFLLVLLDPLGGEGPLTDCGTV